MADFAEIPAELLALLKALSRILATNGTVRRREEPGRRTTWRLRFRATGSDGRRHHYSILLGNEQVALAVAVLVDSWQRQYRRHVQAVRRAEQVRVEQRRKQREKRRMIQQLAGGGWRRRKRIGELYDLAVQQGVGRELAFCLNREYLQPDRRPGRPCKGGLVLLA